MTGKANRQGTIDQRGLTQILVERGTEYRPAPISLDLAHRGVTVIDLALERCTTLGDQGWLLNP